jgi:hypothetical protein
MGDDLIAFNCKFCGGSRLHERPANNKWCSLFRFFVCDDCGMANVVLSGPRPERDGPPKGANAAS